MSSIKIIGEFSNLTLVDLLLLQRLIRHQEPVVRYILYQEVNQLIHPKIKQQLSAEDLFSNSLKPPSLSTSSFYNSLKTLALRGLVKFNLGKSSGKSQKKKIETVEATEDAELVLKYIYGYFLVMMVNDVQYFTNILGEIVKRVGASHFESLLTVNVSEDVDFNLLKFLSELADQVYFLSREELNEDLKKSEFENLLFTNMINNIIREPNDIFDIAIVPGYEKDLEFYELSRIDLLKELKRVIKVGGVVISVVRAHFPDIKNFYGNELLKAYSEAVGGCFFINEELEEDFKAAEFSKIEVFEYQGLIVGIGWV